MNIVAHVLFPIASARFANVYRSCRDKPRPFNWKHLLIIGLCGGIPDFLSPHLGLADRYNSFTHSISFLFLGLLIAILLSLKFPSWRVLFFCGYFAAALHLFCDAIAGGINLYAPFGRMIVGRYYVAGRYWIALDVTAILFCLAPLLFNRSFIRGRAIALLCGYALALLGSVAALRTLDTEKILLEHITAVEVDSVQMERAEFAWNFLYDKWKSGVFETISDNFNEDMRKALSPRSQEELFKQLDNSYGRCQGIKFVEAITARFGFPRIRAYRFKGAFSRTTQEPEIDIFFDSKGKVSGLNFRSGFSKSLL